MHYKLIFILFINFSILAQIPNPTNISCGQSVVDTVYVDYLDFRSCGVLPMYKNSLLVVEDGIIGYGYITDRRGWWEKTETNNPKIIFNSCAEGTFNDVVVHDTIEMTFPGFEECETLIIEDVEFNQQLYDNWICEVYGLLGQKIYKGKYINFEHKIETVYLIRFEGGLTIKRIWYD